MALLALPNEILLLIAKCQDSEKDTNAFARTCRPLYKLINPYLYWHDVELGKDQSLFWAAKHGQHETALKAITAGSDLSAEDEHGDTPLSMALWCKQESMVKLLVEQGAKINTMAGGWPPISHAASQGFVELVRFFLSKGADVNRRDCNGMTPLAYAADRGREDIMEILLATEGVVVDSRDHSGRTPLWSAADRAHSGAVRLLLDHGANINAPDNEGYTPIFAAVNCRTSQDASEAVQVLIERGAQINAFDRLGRTPLISAAKGRVSVVKSLLVHGKGVIDVNKRHAEWGGTALHAAAFGRQTEVTELLLTVEGIDTEIRDTNMGMTALMVSCSYGQVEVARLLLKYTGGSDINSKDSKRGRSPLYLAVERGNIELVNMLLQVDGIDINGADLEGKTPLDRAIELDKEPITQVLRRKLP